MSSARRCLAVVVCLLCGAAACRSTPRERSELERQNLNRQTVRSVEELRAALRQAPDGTVIHVPAGTYTIKRAVDIARDNITVEGEGNKTFFVLAEGARCPGFVIGEPVPATPQITRRGITLRNLRVRGYRAANPKPEDELSEAPGRAHLRNNCVTVRQAEDCLIENVTMENAASGGIVLEQTCRNIRIKDCESFENEFDGIAWDGHISDSVIDDCTLRNNKGAGLSFDIGPSENLISHCVIRDNQTVGIFLRDSKRNCFRDCVIEGNGEDAVFIADGDAPNAATIGNAFVDNVYRNNARNGIWQAGQRSKDNCVARGIFVGNGGQAKMDSFPEEAPLIDCPPDNVCATK